MGTPAIGYNVPGLRDSIVDGKTGILVEPDNVKALGNAMTKLIQDHDLLQELTNNAWKSSRKFTWDKSAKICMENINEILTIVYNKV